MKQYLKKLLIVIAMILPSFCFAGETWGVMTVASKHFSSQKFNQQNFGLGLEHRISPDVTYAIGAYNNSLDRNSAYLLAGYTPIHLGKVKVGIAAGAITGYPEANHGHIAPAALGLISYEGDRFGANIVVIPPVEQKTVLTFGLQIKAKF